MLLNADAQTSGAVITTIPASFTAEDDVKIIIDVSAVGNLAGIEPLYLWTWYPSEPSPGNGSWGSSNDTRVLTRESANKWSFTIKPTDYYGRSPAEVDQIKFLVKAKDGSGDKKTNDIVLNVDPLTFTPTMGRVFPGKIGKDEIVTLFFHQDLATDIDVQRMSPTSVELALYDQSGSVILGNIVKPITKVGDKLYSYSFVPSKLVPIPIGGDLSRIDFKFLGTILDATGLPDPNPKYTQSFTKPFIPLK
jgi:hypothetical protein